MKTKVFLMMVLAALLIGGNACTEDEWSPIDPEGTVLVSILKEDKGKTVISLPAGGDFYIDEGNNFASDENSNLEFCSVGKASGLGNVYVLPSYKGWASIVAVQEGYGYLVRIKKDNSSYICARLYVEKYISGTDDLLGAYVKYQSPVENATY